MPAPLAHTEVSSQIQNIQSVEDLCKLWHQIRPILVAAQGILAFFYPAGAAAIQAVINVLDKVCPSVNMGALGK